LDSSNNTILNFSENNINNDIQLLGISYEEVKGMINYIKYSPKTVTQMLISNNYDKIIQNYITKIFDEEKYSNLIMDIKNITVNDNQTRNIIIELFDDINKNKSSLDYILILLNNTNEYKGILNRTYDFALYNEKIFKNIINNIKRSPNILNDVLCKFIEEKKIIEQSILKLFGYHHTSEFFYKLIHIMVKNKTNIQEMNNFFENTDIKEVLISLTKINDFVKIFGIFSDYFNFELQNKNYNKIILSILREALTMYLYFKKEDIIKNLNIGCLDLLNYTLP
jgi:hypothetical protein